jgi:xylulokinase
MSDSVLLGVDLGAGSLKASVIARDGRLLGEAARPIATRHPRYGWAEQDPEDWIAAFNAAVAKAMTAAGVSGDAVAAVGLSAGAHIPVLLDGEDRPLRPAILWSDTRASAEAAELHARAGDLILERSLNKANATWSLAMLDWIGRHEPEVKAKTKRLCIAKDFLRLRLTGTWETDFSDVIGALMADVRTGGWSEELCALIDWPMETLPPVVEPWHVVGGVTEAAAAASGLTAGTPVVCGSNDTTVEFFGIGALEPGMGAIKLATAGVLFYAADHPMANPPISCYPHILPGMYYTATGTNSCASSHRWVRDTLFMPTSGEADGGAVFAEMDALAAEVPPGSRGLIFHPYLQGERAPYWDPLLRADFLGLTMQHGRAEIARAVYEGIAMSIRDLVEQARGVGQEMGEVKLIGGGAKSATWRQIIADVTGLPMSIPGNGDASFGAALVAGVGAGLFESPQAAVKACVTTVARAEPDAGRHAFYTELFGLYRESQQALAPLNHKLHALAEGQP